MALDAGSTGFTTWADAELVERIRFGRSKFERIAQNQIAFDNRIARQNNAWSLGDDNHLHFSHPFPNLSSTDTEPMFTGVYESWRYHTLGGFLIHDADNHRMDFQVSLGNNTQIASRASFRADTLAPELEVRIIHDVYSSELEMFIGFGKQVGGGAVLAGTFQSRTVLGNNVLVGFVRGATTNTYDAVTWNVTEKDRDTSLSGVNFIGWDRLKVTLEPAQAKFYVHDGTSWVLKATQTTALPVNERLWPMVQISSRGGSTKHSFLDYISSRALSNQVSP